MIKKYKPTMEWIFYDDDEVLRKPCEEVKFPLNDSDWETISKMVSYIDACFYGKESRYKIKAGIGITANQVGHSKKIIYIHFKDNNEEHKYLIANPKIIQENTRICYIENGEGCLSVKKDYDGILPRKSKITVLAIDLFTNKEIEINANGLLAVCLQHEIDHSNGILYYDKINKINPFFKKDDWEKL